jgi:hypothetical protein
MVILEMGDDEDVVYNRLDSLRMRGNMVGGEYVCLSDEQIKGIKYSNRPMTALNQELVKRNVSYDNNPK